MVDRIGRPQSAAHGELKKYSVAAADIAANNPVAAKREIGRLRPYTEIAWNNREPGTKYQPSPYVHSIILDGGRPKAVESDHDEKETTHGQA